VAVSRVGRDADGSGGFAYVKLRFPSLIEQNPAAFATGVMAEAARRSVGWNDV